MERTRIPNGINLAAGLWLTVSPWLLGYSQVYALTPNDVFWGIVVALLAASRLWWHQGAWAAWTDFVLGVWIVASPAILGADDPAFMINHAIVGLVVVAMSVWSALLMPRIVSGTTFSAAEPDERELRERGDPDDV